MNKTTWIIIAIIVVVVLGFFIFRGGEDTTSNVGSSDTTIDNAPDSAFPDLQTSDDVFNELDSTLDYIE
jgi:hypothetical protein